MGTTSTVNYGLTKPNINEEQDIWGGEINHDLDLIDTQMKINADAIAAVSVVASGKVSSVFGRTGVVVAAANDYTIAQITGLQAALDLKSDKGVVDRLNTYTGSSTLALADSGGVVIIDSASASIITIPAQSSVAWASRTRIDLIRLGVGEVSLLAGAGVTLHSADSKLRVNKQYSGVTLVRNSPDSWLLIGDIKT